MQLKAFVSAVALWCGVVVMASSAADVTAAASSPPLGRMRKVALRCPGGTAGEALLPAPGRGMDLNALGVKPSQANLWIANPSVHWGVMTCRAPHGSRSEGLGGKGVSPDDGCDPVTNYTKNWSGYQFQASSRPWGVEANWNVPAVSHVGSTNNYLSEWVGLGNGTMCNNTEWPLVQAGTETDSICTTSSCSSSRQQNYMWYELFPNATQSLQGPPVSPGQNVYVQVSVPSSSQALLCNRSTNSCDSAQIAGAKYQPLPYVYEWIVERTSYQDALYNPPNFHWIRFTNAYWDYSVSGRGQMSDSQLRISMTQGSTVKSSCHETSNTSFVCQYQ
ncbi:G1 family glutamic endopeptidase [Branchiibius sp. NY16-3462-2]|uniref:G1 family glutamic endopeptidase n=1 Tax=Branchiibius sp. NY16-3462-2 TaxID=1807500 RepID=UPI0026B97E62